MTKKLKIALFLYIAVDVFFGGICGRFLLNQRANGLRVGG